MFSALAIFFAIFTAADIFFAAAVVWHLRRYTLPDWQWWKLIVLVHAVFSLIFIALAFNFLIQIKSFNPASPWPWLKNALPVLK